MNMIEKVGLALGKAAVESPYYIIPRFKNKYDVMEAMPPKHADYCHLMLAPLDEARKKLGQLELNYCAKAAITAMREPTEEMIKAGDDKQLSFNMQEIETEETYKAMIDAALKDG